MAKGKKSQPVSAQPDPPEATQAHPPAGDCSFSSCPFALAHLPQQDPLLLPQAARPSPQQVLACPVTCLPFTGGPDVPAISAEALNRSNIRRQGRPGAVAGTDECAVVIWHRARSYSWQLRSGWETSARPTAPCSPGVDFDKILCKPPAHFVQLAGSERHRSKRHPLSLLLYPIADVKPVEQAIAEQLKLETGFLDYPLGSEVPEAGGRRRRRAS
eukprot:766523-Hanusia_phi.AAC.9